MVFCLIFIFDLKGDRVFYCTKKFLKILTFKKIVDIIKTKGGENANNTRRFE